MFIIGLIGAKQAGKTTFFNEFSIKNPKFHEIALAYKLKAACSNAFDLSLDAFNESLQKDSLIDPPVFISPVELRNICKNFEIPYTSDMLKFTGKILHTPRQIMQYVGTEVLRAIDASIHCKSVAFNNPQNLYVVTDIRFLSEFMFFAEKTPNFMPIYIKNTSAEIVAAEDNHASENSLQLLAKHATIIIENEGSLQDFTKKINKFQDLMEGSQCKNFYYPTHLEKNQLPSQFSL